MFPFLLRGDLADFTVASTQVIPVHVPGEMMLCIIVAAKLKALDQFSVQDTMESLDVGVFLRCSHVGKLLLCFQLGQKLPHLIGNELRAIVVADKNAFQIVGLVQHAEQIDDIHFADAFLEKPVSIFLEYTSMIDSR